MSLFTIIILSSETYSLNSTPGCRRAFSEPYISSLGIFKDAIIAILSALAKQEKVRIGERTKAGQERTVRVNGTRLGRPKTDPGKIKKVLKLRSQGMSYGQIAKAMDITRARACQLARETSCTNGPTEFVQE